MIIFMIMIKTKIMIMITYLSINIITNIIVTKNIVNTKH